MVIGRLGPEYHTVDLTGCVPERRGTALLSWEPNMRLARLSVRLGALALVLCGCAAELTRADRGAFSGWNQRWAMIVGITALATTTVTSTENCARSRIPALRP